MQSLFAHVAKSLFTSKAVLIVLRRTMATSVVDKEIILTPLRLAVQEQVRDFE